MVKNKIASFAAIMARKSLRLMGKGATTLPGKIAIKISPSIIKEKAAGKNIITITGTNGKTTTSHMISDMLVNLGYDVINNISGANLQSGIATTLICGKDEIKKANGKSKGLVYVLETDEAAFAKTAEDLNPKVSVVTNLFRDQLDRYGELTHTRDFIKNGINKTDAVAILNSDDSLVASIGKGRENKAIYFGMNKNSMYENGIKYPPRKGIIPASPDAVYCPECKVRYEYKARSFGHLGDFMCPSCGFKSPDNRFSVIYDLKDSPSDENYPFAMRDEDSDKTIDMNLKVPGSHNLYNTCAAISGVSVLTEIISGTSSSEGKCFEESCASSNEVKAAFGRMEKISYKGKNICILLVKNPVGLDRSLSFVEESKDADSLMLLLNSNIADGKDVSWIWDVDFETKIEGLPKNIYVSGQRFSDMKLRVEYAGGKVAKCADMDSAKEILLEAIDKCEEGKCVYILPNYTSMLALRAMLVKDFGINDFWK